ncbi:MAG: putative secreted protein [Gemmatimonadetes bacterium]|nr:putative secreted protein [Gemmatimonadota bacterium]
MANVVNPEMQTKSADNRIKFLPFVRVSGHEQPHASVLEDGVTMAVGGFTLFALFLDGWRHNNMIGLDNFWALPHLLLYAGLSMLGLWIAIVLLRHQKGGLRDLDWSAVPYGYGLAFVALPLAALAGNADFKWHAVFGFENQIDSTYSPPHQLLFLAGTLLAAIPAASAWQRRGTATSLGKLLPALISVSTIVAMTMFVIHQSTPFYGAAAMTPAFQQDIATRADAYAPGSGAHHIEGLSPALKNYGDEAFPYYFYTTHHTIGGLLLTSFMLFGGVLVMRRRWKLPFGSLTIMFAWLAWQLPLLSQYREWKLALSLVVAGVIGDVLLATLVGTEGPIRVGRVRIFATIMPVILWGLFLLFLGYLGDGVGWGPTLWTGVLTTSAGFGYAMSLFVFPPFEGTTIEQVPAASSAA